MTVPTLSHRYQRLVSFAHSRREPALTPAQVAERTALPVGLLESVERGAADFTHEEAAAVATALGLNDADYLAAQPEDSEAAVAMYERLLLLIQARDLGVQHIAARDTCGGEGFISTVRARLSLLARH